MRTIDLSTLVKVGEASRRLGVSATSVYKYANDGMLPPIWIAGTLHFRVGDVDKLAAERQGRTNDSSTVDNSTSQRTCDSSATYKHHGNKIVGTVQGASK